jgi:hypothetical protein
MSSSGSFPSFNTNDYGRNAIAAACELLKSGDATECTVHLFGGSFYARIHTIEITTAQANMARVFYGGKATSCPSSPKGIALIPYFMVSHVDGLALES